MALSAEEKAKREKVERADIRCAVDFVIEFVKQLTKEGRLKFMNQIQATFSREFRELDKRSKQNEKNDE